MTHIHHDLYECINLHQEHHPFVQDHWSPTIHHDWVIMRNSRLPTWSSNDRSQDEPNDENMVADAG
jgi:hypothetical protein